jgi:hypothetical protein
MSSNYALTVGGGANSGAAVAINGPLSGFGELETVTPVPTSQVAFVYNLNPLLVTSDVYGAGASVTAVNGEVVVASGTAVDGYARLISKKVAKYRAGQATMARWTARFTTGSAGNRQMAGLYNIEAGYQFGYDGTAFGILYTETATVEVQTLTITAAPTGAGNVTVTLDAGTPVVVAVTNQPNTSVTASQIAAADYTQTAGGWDAQSIANVVYFTRRTAGTAGPSTFSAGAVPGIAGTFAILTVGVAPTEQFISQASWNQDTFLGGGGASNPSGITLDPTKGNVYEVQFQYLGYGDAYFYIVNGTTGRPTLCHIVRNANTRTSTVLRNPNLYLTWESRNTGTGTSVTMRGASGGAFVEGPVTFLGAQFAVPPVAVTAGAGVETPILSLRGNTVYVNRQSTAQLQIDRISVACDGTKTVLFKVYKNATLTAPRWQNVNATTSAASYDQNATAFSVGAGTLVYAFAVSKAGNATESLTDIALFLQAGDYLTITATSTNANDVAATIVWIEDI